MFENNEHEEREDKREELHAFIAHRAAHRLGDKLIGHFGSGLHAAGNHGAT